MLTIDHERNASECIFYDVLAQSKEIVSYFWKIFMFYACSELNDKHHIGLPNQFRG